MSEEPTCSMDETGASSGEDETSSVSEILGLFREDDFSEQSTPLTTTSKETDLLSGDFQQLDYVGIDIEDLLSGSTSQCGTWAESAWLYSGEFQQLLQADEEPPRKLIHLDPSAMESAGEGLATVESSGQQQPHCEDVTSIGGSRLGLGKTNKPG